MSKIPPTSLQIHLYGILSLLIFTLPFHGNSQTTDPELTILLKLKQHWSNPPSIKHWNSSSLNSNSTHCTWPEITCTGGSVYGLSLGDKNITATIPPFICDLQNLTLLDLNYNNIPGPFPTVLYNCSNLQYLDLSSNYFVAPIPDDVHRLSSRLRELKLAYNNFSGDIPASIGLLSELRTLHIEANEFNGTFPQEIGYLSNLEVLWMGYNEFAPSKIPSSFTQLKKLEYLLLSTSNLIGEIPETIGNMTALKVLDLSTNQLTGNIPSGVFLLKNLTSLHLHKNNLSGVIPARISSLRSLTVLEASNNLFTGTIPQELTVLLLLTTLLLDRNRLSGQFPSEVVSWKSLTKLNLSGNLLSGTIPAEIGSLPVLTDLDLSGNQFSGQIPPQIGHLNLTLLNLSSNSLTGRIPVKFENAAFDASFLNNPGLCATNPSLGLEVCSSGARKSDRMSSQLFAILISIASVLFVLAIIFTFFVIKVHRKREPGLDSTWKLTAFQRLNFTESSILSSLNENCMIGSGGSGKVYRVAVNRSSEFVAVKRIWNNRNLDQSLEKQFLAEVAILGTIRHSNIVKLLCCMSNENTKLLVYEYLENGSLDEWLHGKKRQRQRQTSESGSVNDVIVLDWSKRFQIAVGAAQGLSYMHSDCSQSILHRDVKSSNILLDSEFNAKIADFGVARILLKRGEPNTMSVMAGSFGYIAPEYAQTTRVSEKIDVYSFGVVLLELATGRKAKDGDENMGLAGWACCHIQKGKPIEDALDEDIKEACYLNEMKGLFELGIICTHTLPSERPTMKEVLKKLRHLSSARI